MIILIWSVVIIVAVTLYLRQHYSKFQRLDVKHFKPVPLLGNMTRILLRQDHFAKQIEDLYNSFPGER
jgi:hypothetical protein